MPYTLVVVAAPANANRGVVVVVATVDATEKIS
jgi:hypothetical protein